MNSPVPRARTPTAAASSSSATQVTAVAAELAYGVLVTGEGTATRS